jgi:hypothetical protein
MVMRALAVGISALIVICWAGAARATVVGVPFGGTKFGTFIAQGAYATSQRTLSGLGDRSATFTFDEAAATAGIGLGEFRLAGVQFSAVNVHTSGLGTMTGTGTGAFFQESERGTRTAKKFVSFRYQSVSVDNSNAALDIVFWDAIVGLHVKGGENLNYRVAGLFTLAWGDLKSNAGTFSSSTTVSNDSYFGVLGGLDYTLAPWLSLGAEARLISETSLAATLTGRF